MIRTQYVPNTSTKTLPIDGYKVINVLKWTGTPWKALCPFLLKTDGKEELSNPGGIIFENFWQGAKVFNIVYPQKQYASRFHQTPEHLWFSHNMSGSLLHTDGSLNLAKYTQWRDLVWACTRPVRYPNGHNHRSEVLYALVDDGRRLDYLQSRKEIYVREYCRLIGDTPEFKLLQDMHRAGQNLCIAEMDVPKASKNGAYRKYTDKSESGGIISVPLTVDILEELLNDPSAPFGHGLCIAMMLLSK